MRRRKYRVKSGKSGIGLPHSTTLARILACHSYREVVECGSPMPLWQVDFHIQQQRTAAFCNCNN